MASMPLTTSTFIEKLLAPLPAGEEPVESPRFLKFLEAEKLVLWDREMDQVRIAEAAHQVVEISRRYPDSHYSEEDALMTFRMLQEATLKQCLVPAPTMKQVKWKQNFLKDRHPKVPQFAPAHAALKADLARLAGGNA